ncbi:MAG: hypothetical protein P8008_00655 [Gammaproteobacteria bacterium]
MTARRRTQASRWLTAACLALALLLYAAGAALAAGLLFLLGAAAEAVFWVRLMRRR